MTAVYARLADTTIREQWERAQEINIRGEPVDTTIDETLADGEWMKQNLARAKMALPNGYCGLPLQKSCPHANACLTCPLFITTAEFLPQHRKQLDATRALITRAQTDGHTSLAEMNHAKEVRIKPGTVHLGVSLPQRRRSCAIRSSVSMSFRLAALGGSTWTPPTRAAPRATISEGSRKTVQPSWIDPRKCQEGPISPELRWPVVRRGAETHDPLCSIVIQRTMDNVIQRSLESQDGSASRSESGPVRPDRPGR